MTFNNHLDLVQRLRINGAIPPSPLYTFMKWTGTISHLPLFTLPYLFVSFPSLFLIYLFILLFIYLFVCLFVWRPGWRSRCSNSLRSRRSAYWTPVRAKISVTVHIRPEVHPASRTMGTGSFSGLKRPRRGADYSPLASAKVANRMKLYTYLPPQFCSCTGM